MCSGPCSGRRRPGSVPTAGGRGLQTPHATPGERLRERSACSKYAVGTPWRETSLLALAGWGSQERPEEGGDLLFDISALFDNVKYFLS